MEILKIKSRKWKEIIIKIKETSLNVYSFYKNWLLVNSWNEIFNTNEKELSNHLDSFIFVNKNYFEECENYIEFFDEFVKFENQLDDFFIDFDLKKNKNNDEKELEEIYEKSFNEEFIKNKSKFIDEIIDDEFWILKEKINNFFKDEKINKLNTLDIVFNEEEIKKLNKVWIHDFRWFIDYWKYWKDLLYMIYWDSRINKNKISFKDLEENFIFSHINKDYVELNLRDFLKEQYSFSRIFEIDRFWRSILFQNWIDKNESIVRLKNFWKDINDDNIVREKIKNEISSITWLIYDSFIDFLKKNWYFEKWFLIQWLIDLITPDWKWKFFETIEKMIERNETEKIINQYEKIYEEWEKN